MQIDDTLVDSHLEAVPGLGTLSARSLLGGDPKSLGRKLPDIQRYKLIFCILPFLKKTNQILYATINWSKIKL